MLALHRALDGRRIAVVAATVATLLWVGALPSEAGNIYLTGHDTLLHDGQAGYDSVILDYLRCAGTPDETPAGSYSIAVLGSGVGTWGWSDVPGFGDMGSKPGYASTTYYDTDDLISSTVSWSTVLSADCLVILSHTTCGGCDIDDPGVAEINANAGLITAAFNAGMDLWVNSGANSATYYNFLPPAFATAGPPISGSTGFVATPAGAGIGIVPTMINGFQTHNRFDGYSSALTPMEVRPNSTLPGGEEIISLGAKGITLGCLDVTDEQLTCDALVAGKFNYTFTITNNSGVDAEHIKLVPEDLDGDGTPDYSLVPDTFNVSLPDGASTTITTCILGVPENTEICFEIWLLDATLEQCCVQVHCVTTPSCCFELLTSSIDCVAGATNEWVFTFNLQNNAPYAIDRLFLWPTSGFLIDPDEFYLSPIPTGGTTGPLSVVISGASPGDVVCFEISVHNSMTGECCSGELICVTLPSCDPCDEPDSCHVPPITTLCRVPGTPFLEATFILTICNNCSEEPVAFDYHFDSAVDDCCPTPWVDPMFFSPSAGATPPLGLGECIDIPITVSIEVTLFPPGELSCFHVHVLNLSTGSLVECGGKLRSPSDIVIKAADPVPVDIAYPSPGAIGFTFEAGTPGLAGVDVAFELQATQPAGPIVSIGGLDPAAAFLSSVTLLAPGSVSPFFIEARFTDHEPFVFYDIILLADVDGDGVPEEAASQTIRSVLPADCNGNGIPDDIDIALGTSADADGNGIPDECEGTSTSTTGTPFLRGDSNNDGSFDVADV
ncbi:MAG: hypothetical protein KDC38_03350, partial [Planctomycetes bacterium]|nr:hypothetical protein [Planctomycetota bacterium]